MAPYESIGTIPESATKTRSVGGSVTWRILPLTWATKAASSAAVMALAFTGARQRLAMTAWQSVIGAGCAGGVTVAMRAKKNAEGPGSLPALRASALPVAGQSPFCLVFLAMVNDTAWEGRAKV